MCFGSKEKTAEPGPRPTNTSYSQNATASYPKPSVQNQQIDYEPPADPPPSHRQQSHQDFAPPLGPPPSHSQSEYAPPPGLPPSRQTHDYAPPPGPPPSQKQPHPPPDAFVPHPAEWELAVPDTSLFPPPPAFFSGHDRSWTTNADEVEARAGEEWCAANPLQPISASSQHVAAVQRAHTYTLRTPAAIAHSQAAYGARAATSQAMNTARGVWNLRTQPNEKDTTWVAFPPAYSVQLNNARTDNDPATVYYEVRVKSSLTSGEATAAIGYTALPYPDWRMPGWHRGSLAVHGDDGHRYVNDRWGGVEFTQPFEKGDTVGLGIRFERIPGVSGASKVTCFFTRNGKLDGTWDVNEEEDSDVNISKVGLQGSHDLCYAVGAYKDVDIDVVFDPAQWMFSPETLVL
ncbi:hypothetical protein TD95_004182 [Thielaviopsis punctulata]|uniref:SPRY domain-containing protein n=1 Tax=Thielaviopsis punctulata TaxID=72032 RepID=A0A0F4ZG41_9PEZI|nr:hypothetical protein TD95_004182 [Thielaviopsis punctulata]